RSALASLLSHPLPRHLFPVDFAANLISIRSRRTRISTLFPYTTLFRSHQGYARFGMLDEGDSFSVLEKQNNEEVILNDFVCDGRSEEHTSELQSRFDLVCRLLLEKKTRSAADGHRFTCRRWCCGTRVGY